MFYAYASVALIALTAAIVAATYLAKDQRRRLVLVVPVIVLTPVIMAFPAGWLAEIIPAGTNYWGGANPLAVMAAWPTLTAIAYYIAWLVMRSIKT